jgi:hypothetical protein
VRSKFLVVVVAVAVMGVSSAAMARGGSGGGGKSGGHGHGHFVHNQFRDRCGRNQFFLVMVSTGVLAAHIKARAAATPRL